MKQEEIHLYDWGRILFGEVPYVFFIESFLRGLVLFVILIVSMRILGRRMAAMLDMHELSALVALGAAIGIPILSPDRGLIPAFIIAIVVVSIQKAIFFIGYKYKKVELLIHGDLITLVEDGILNLSNMKKSIITKNYILGKLRAAGVKNLGEVQRVYLETNGNFTIIKNDNDSIPGLCIIPSYDEEYINKSVKKINTNYSCHYCGNTKNSLSKPIKKCEQCNHNNWVSSVIHN